ncbi:hypothetical protein BGX28_003879 [Mortierella sp. GBA30]|nr:hypothetical protein BGX28_003879 [Mortierella sp. GBA30]
MRLVTIGLGACALLALSSTQAQDVVAPATAPINAAAVDAAIAAGDETISIEGLKNMDASIFPSLKELESRVKVFNAFAAKATAPKKKTSSNKPASVVKDTVIEKGSEPPTEKEQKEIEKEAKKEAKKETEKKSDDEVKKAAEEKEKKEDEEEKIKKEKEKKKAQKKNKKVQEESKKAQEHEDHQKQRAETKNHLHANQGSKDKQPFAATHNACHHDHHKPTKAKPTKTKPTKTKECVVYVTITMVPKCKPTPTLCPLPLSPQPGGTSGDQYSQPQGPAKEYPEHHEDPIAVNPVIPQTPNIPVAEPAADPNPVTDPKPGSDEDDDDDDDDNDDTDVNDEDGDNPAPQHEPSVVVAEPGVAPVGGRVPKIDGRPLSEILRQHPPPVMADPAAPASAPIPAPISEPAVAPEVQSPVLVPEPGVAPEVQSPVALPVAVSEPAVAPEVQSPVAPPVVSDPSMTTPLNPADETDDNDDDDDDNGDEDEGDVQGTQDQDDDDDDDEGPKIGSHVSITGVRSLRARQQ